MVSIELRPLPEDHAILGYRVTHAKNLKTVNMRMIADSGCQSSIIPLASALKMGYAEKDLIPVTLSMKGAIDEDLAMQGAIIVEISVKDDIGGQRTSKQMVYVSYKMEKAFLCREAMEN